jgi:hypothetical protein
MGTPYIKMTVSQIRCERPPVEVGARRMHDLFVGAAPTTAGSTG